MTKTNILLSSRLKTITFLPKNSKIKIDMTKMKRTANNRQMVTKVTMGIRENTRNSIRINQTSTKTKIRIMTAETIKKGQNNRHKTLRRKLSARVRDRTRRAKAEKVSQNQNKALRRTYRTGVPTTTEALMTVTTVRNCERSSGATEKTNTSRK